MLSAQILVKDVKKVFWSAGPYRFKRLRDDRFVRPRQSDRCAGLRAALVVAAVFVAALAAEQQTSDTSVWPVPDWLPATPESQGLDSGVLADMLEWVHEHHLPVHSILIIRHGRLVLDATFYPYDGSRPHDIASATKSITSLLIGLALDKGLVKNVQERVIGLLPDAAPAISDPRRARLTIEDLLTMRSGLDCGFTEGERELAQMRRSDDWAAFALALPMRAEPGTEFAYCSCNNHLLSGIISSRTGRSALEFARQYLFDPLGIRDVIWPADPKGRTHGWGDLHMYPRDLAKIAYLYLHRGRWIDRQLVSEDWVRESIVPRVSVRPGVRYGYGWWLNTAREPPVFEAEGRGGQRAAVLPDKDLVVVFNGGGVNTDEIAPFLFRAIRSDTSLAENPTSAARLRGRLEQARQPPPAHRPASLPELARLVSGISYEIEANALNLQRLRLTFSGEAEAQAMLRLSNEEWTVPIGLDGRYRFSSEGPGRSPIAAKGEWVSADEFLLDLDTVANINHFSIHIQFAGRQVQLRINEATGEIKELAVTGRTISIVR